MVQRASFRAHSIDALVALAYSYYPRAPWYEIPEGAEETQRLKEARRRAGANYAPWGAMLSRLAKHFPACTVQDRSIHLRGSDSFDACYSAWLYLPTLPEHVGRDSLGFLVSFLAPYYVVYRERYFFIPGTAPKPWGDVSDGFRFTNAGAAESLSFELTAEDEPYARVLAAEIEATFGCEPLPPEIGNEIIPDIAPNAPLGRATLYNCLFTTDW